VESTVLAAGPEAPALARDFVAGMDLGLPAEREHHLELMVSELVTNSVVHAGLESGDPIDVGVRSRPDRVRIEVTDAGAGFDRREEAADRDGLLGGWGLVIVERLASRWGVASDSRFAVWFEIDR
jgi:anti-sigma regulatory factor (Ser/Thr protein kinase)